MVTTVISKFHKAQQGIGTRLLVAIALLAAILVTALWGLKDLYGRYLERTSPEIIFSESLPRGVGISPVTVPFTLKDNGAGLDEVVVRVKQRKISKEILRRALGGRKEAEISIDFGGEKSGFEEGTLSLEIKVFDRSFWSNAAEKTLELQVDYRKPRLEVLSVQHNARRGGSQLILYKAFDQSLAVSGVKVGNQTFLGFPASGIDKDFQDPNLFMALYAIDLRLTDPNPTIRLFAQDIVGNAVSIPFNNKILGRPDRTVSVAVGEDYLTGPVTELTNSNLRKIEEFARESGDVFLPPPNNNDEATLLAKFHIVNEKLRMLNDQELIGQARKAPRFEKYWTGAFQQPAGIVNTAFGDTVLFKYNNAVIGKALSTGYEFGMGRDGGVFAVADGIVVLSSNLGIYGRVVVVDHGLGMASVYGRLDSVSVAEGEVVTAGQELGVTGRTGLTKGNQLYFELRLQGVPVDPREWWDKSWYYGHIIDQINSVKRALGMAVEKPL